MKQIFTTVLLLILTIALIPVEATIGTPQINAADSQSQHHLRVRTKVSPRAPVGIGSAAATMTDNQIVLRYALDERAGKQLPSVELLAFTLDESGRVKGGEGWTAPAAATENGRESLLRILKSRPEAADQLMLTVWRVGSAFEVNETELSNMLRPRASRAERALKPRLVKAALMEGEYCLDRLAVVKTSCACGVKSFSCNASSGEWSFTCYTKAESPSRCTQAEGESD
ncbi:MAG TPA: hypothetical protein VEY11_18995 [Pyrinomonadaceae bacterium]|nr:hypothetical protein [Pyrinomonadaceae bacterium]